MEHSTLGYLYLALTVLMWSLAPSYVSKASRRIDVDAATFNAWRILFASLITLPLALYYGFPWRIPWLNPWFELGVFIGGVLSTVVGDTLFVYSVSKMGASIAIPLAYLFVIWSALIDYFMGYEGWIVLPAAFIAVAGIWASYAGFFRSEAKGLLATIAASIIWAASLYGYDYAMGVLVASGMPPLASSIVIAELRALYSVAAFTPYLARLSRIRLVIGEVLASSITGYVLGSITFIAALGFLAPSIVSLGLALTPMTTQFVSRLVAGEEYSRRAILGSILVGFSISIISIWG